MLNISRLWVKRTLPDSAVTCLLLSWFQFCTHLTMNYHVWSMECSFNFNSKQSLTSKSCAPCSSISGTKSVIGRGKRGGKFFLESVTSVGHSSSGGKPITLKKRDHCQWDNMNQLPKSGICDGNNLLLTREFCQAGPLLILRRTKVWQTGQKVCTKVKKVKATLI